MSVLSVCVYPILAGVASILAGVLMNVWVSNEIFSVERMDLSRSFIYLMSLPRLLCVKCLPFRLTNHKIGTVAVKTPVYCPTKQAATSSLPAGNRQRPSASQPVHPASSDNKNYSFEDAQVGRRPSKNPKTAPEYDTSESKTERFLPESLFDHQERQREHNHPTNMAGPSNTQ